MLFLCLCTIVVVLQCYLAAAAGLASRRRKLAVVVMACMLCCSPLPALSSPATGGAAVVGFSSSSRRKAAHVHPAVAVKDHDLSSSSPAACGDEGGGAVVIEEEAHPSMMMSVAAPAMKKKAVAARWRPPRLVVPAVAGADEAMAAAAAVKAAKEKEEEEAMEVEGEGFWVASRRGLRHAMEDGYGVITHKIEGHSQMAFYGVYDGHGGRAAVDFVAGRLGNNVVTAAEKQRLSEKASSPAAADHVAAAIRAAGGACAATALVIDGDLYVANLGDCRAVISRHGAAAALTSDHTPARDDERSRIESSGGYVSCGSNGVWRVQDCLAVTRSFGDGGLKRWVVAEPEVSRTPLAGAGCEFLVIASDGLWNKVSNQEAVDAVAAGHYSVDSCRRLVDMARRRGSRDDVTVMVVDLKRFLNC
uniref:protein-serine/threonine phosphatase n=1 Tax=Oryza rufipogon TaxID=4529 RepID=A0A0E0R692_ORYRU